MKYSNTVEYNIKTSLDSKGLTQLRSELQGLEIKLQNMGNKGFLNEKSFSDARDQIQGLGQALTDAFNPSLGMLDLSKLNQELKNNGVTAQGLKTAFSSLGAEGQVAFNNLVGELGKLDTGILRTNSQVDKLFTTFSNTFRWGLVSSFFSQFMNAVHSSVNYVKELDDSLTQIMLVTDYNRDSMNEFAKSANEAAKAVSMTTTGMTNASLIFAQQGYDLGQSQELATLSAKVANASQQDTATTSDQITAYMNAYGLENSIGELTQAMDNWALIANISAADVGELAQASQRAASMANAVGVSGEQLASQIATIESVTREAPEQIGNGLKTLYARFSDIATGKEDEDGFTLGKVTSELNKIGVQVLDEMGQIRDVGDIMEDLMVIWDDLDQTSKVAASQALAGKYQVNRFMALMDNSDMYEEYKGATGANAAGTLDMMNEEYAQSIEGRSAKLQASLEGLFSTIFNTDDIYPWMDAAQGAIDLLQQFFDALGGGKTVLLGISSLLMQVFSKNVAQEINNAATNRAVQQQKIANLQHSEAALTTMGLINPNPEDQNSKNILEFAQYMNKRALEGGFNAEQMNQANAIYEEMIQSANTATIANEKLEQQLGLVGTVINSSLGESGFAPFADFSKAINSIDLKTVLGDLSDKTLTDFFVNTQEEVKEAKNGLLGFNKTLQEYSALAADSGTDTEVLQGKMNELQNELKELSNYLDDSTFKRYDKALDEIANDTDAAVGKTDELATSTAKLATELDNATAKGAKKAFDDLQKTAFQSANADIAFEDANATRLAFQESNEKTDHITNILNTMNAVQQLTFAWQAFQNLGSIWANAELTDGEKILQTIMNLSMAIPQLIIGFGQLGTSIKNVGSFLQNSYFTALKETAMAELESAKAAEAKQKQQKDIIEAERAALKVQLEKIRNDQDEAQGEIFLAQLEVEKNQTLVDTLSILDLTNQKTLDKAKAELEVANNLVTEMQAQEALNKVRLNSLKQEYNIKEASGKLGNKERSKYRKAIAEGESLSQNDAVQVAEAENLVNEAKIRVQTAEEKQAATSAALTSAREKLTDSTNRLATAEEKFASSKEKLQEIESKINSTISGSLSVLADFKNAQEAVTSASTKYAKIIGLAKGESLTLGTAIKGLPVAFSKLASAVGLTTTGLGIFMGVAAAAVAVIGGIAYVINKESEEQKARAEALEAISQKTIETAKSVKESLSEWNQIKDEFYATGEASDAFIDSLLKQAEALGINNAEVDIATGHYEELIKKIDEAREAALKAENTLSAQQLQNTNPADDLTKEQKENLGISTHIETEVIEGAGTNTGTSITKATEVYDQSAYEQILAIQNGIAEKQQEINDLNQKWDEAIREGNADLAASYSQQKGAVAAQQQELQQIADKYQNISDAVQSMEEDSIIGRATANDDFANILSTGSFEEVKEAVKETLEAETSLTDQLGKIDNTEVEKVAASMMKLYENSNLAAEAVNRVNGSTPEDNYRSDEEKKNIQESLNLSDEEYTGYQNALLDDNEHLQALSDQIRYREDNADAIAAEQEALRSETSELEKSKQSLEEKSKNLRENTRSYEQNQKEIADLNKQIEENREKIEDNARTSEDYQEQLEDLESKIIETALGAKELGEIWEDNSAVLRDSDSDWAQQADAINNLAPGLAHLLNMDLSEIQTLPQSFWESTQNLDDMEAAINGDVEALQRLRGEAAQELLIKAGVDPTSNLYGEMVELIDMANAVLPSLEAGATINDSQFIAKLNEMVATTKATGGQIESVLAAYERLGLQFTQVGSSKMQIPHITMSRSGSIDMGGDLGKTLGAVAASVIPNVSWETVDIPRYEYKKTSGGAGFTGGYTPKSSGGGGGGKSCFVAGTLISTSFGYKSIELIKPNDFVLSYNESLHQNEYSKVVQTMIHDTIEPIYTLYIKNEQLRVTGIHRFLVSKDIGFESQWIAAQDLQIGDWVLLADGTWHLIWKIEINLEHQIVYNFEVAGNHNYYVGRNQILAHNKGGGGKKGGSGSGSKAKTIEQKEKKEHEKDYYEEVNNQLEKTDKILSKIQKEQDRLMGDKAIANQNKQIKLLQKEIALNKDKLDIQKQELADVNALIKKNDERAEQAAKAQGIAASVPEIQLDEDGIVSNYEQISAKIDEIHNQLIDKYNAAAERSDEELTKEIAKSIEKFDEYGENLLKDIQRHNKLQSEIEETNNTLEELDDTIEDIRIDAYKAYQEAQDNFKELKENAAEMAAIFQDFNEEGFLTKWSLDDTPIGDMTKAMYELDNIYNVSKEDANDFYDSIIAQKEKEKQKATDPDEKAAIQSSIDFFEGQKANLTSDTLINGVVGRAIHDVQQLQGWIDGTNTEPNPFGENTAALWETYEEAYKRATDTYKDWRETVQDLRDAVIDAYDEQEDALERNLDEYDRIIDHLERINDTYTLYYGEDSYDGVLQIMDRQGATMQQHLNDLTDAFIYWQKKYQEALENGDEKLIQSIREKMEDAEDAMYDKAEEIAEHWVERYEKAVDASIQKIDIKLWGGGPGQMDLEDQSTIWELQKDYMDTYKDDVEKAYEVDKLRSKYVNLLNDAQGMSLQTQNKIRAQMQEQLALLDGQKTVSEYDVKLANAKLEILQKQIALEDAQRNKNKMQLRRDTQGNYRYVYTADQGDVQQAQDELNESQFDAYEMTKEQTIANNDRAINLYQDYMEKMRDIANKYKDDEVARNAAMKALSEEYGKLLEALGEDFKDTTNGMYEVLMWMIDKGTQDTSTAAMDMLDQLYDKNGEVKENTGNAWRDLATQITKDVLPNINEAVAQGFADINDQASTLKEQMTGDNGVLTKIGSSTDTLKDSIDKAKEATTQWAIETENLFNAFSADNPKVQEAMKQLQAMEAQLKANEQATSALATKYREANDLLTAKTAEAANYKRALENPNEYEYKDGKVVKKEPPKTSNNGGNNGGAKSFSNGSIVGFRGSYSENSWGEGRWGNMYSGRANAVRISSFSRRSGYGPRNVHLETLGGGHLGWVTQSQLFDTGGYTGKWNSNEGMPNSKNGKLAVLHQKELVLNERDTENILTAVSMIRQISTSMQGALSNISTAASNNVSSNYNPITEQRVEIQASFPNATDADDIRQALIGLSDRAYQYAHRVI